MFEMRFKGTHRSIMKMEIKVADKKRSWPCLLTVVKVSRYR